MNTELCTKLKMDSKVARFYAVWIEKSKITLDTIMQVFQSVQHISKVLLTLLKGQKHSRSHCVVCF